MAGVATTRAGGGARTWRDRAAGYGAVALAYTLVTSLTGALYMGDTGDYVASVVTRLEGGYYAFWDFGHLYWRPLVWLCYRAAGPLAGGDARLGVMLVSYALNWVAGLAAALALFAAALRLGARPWVAHATALALVCSNAFLNYAQTGCSYVPGLAALLVGLHLLLGDPAGGRERARGVAAGVSMAVAVGFWLPYVLTLPACLCAPLLLADPWRARLRLVLTAAVACGLVVALSYLAVAAGPLGVHDAAGLRAWVAESSHGITNKGGVARAVFGLARSLVNMGDDGRVFKRFLLHDPYNPVTAADLLRQSLWKLALFYGAAAAVILTLSRTARARRLLALLALNAAPVFAFALVLFTAGDIERYLPLYPFMLLGLAAAVGERRAPWRGLNHFLVVCIVVASAVNVWAMRNSVLARQREDVGERVRVLGGRLKPSDRVAVTHFQDDLASFNNNPRFERAGPPVHTFEVVTPGTEQATHWRADFAARARQVWREGGEVWLSRRLLAPRPRPEWNWVEGDDRNVSWRDLYGFFSSLDAGEGVGGEDGFVLLARTPPNEAALAAGGE